MYPQNLLRRQVVEEKKKRTLGLFTGLTVVVVYLFWIFLFGEDGIIKFSELKKRRIEVMDDVARLQQQNIRLKEEIRLLEENGFAVERYAREELNLSRPDEYVFIFDK